jgi:flagellar biosynthetic protein FliR
VPLEQYLPLQAYVLMLVLVRVGGVVALMPGIGEAHVQTQVRLFFAIAVSLLIGPVVADKLPARPPSAMGFLVLVFGEFMIGAFLGLVTRILVLTLDTAGRVISFSTGLANAQVFNPSISSQASLPGLFLTTVGIVVLFATDMHQVVLVGVAESYDTFPPGEAPMIADMSAAMVKLVSSSFEIGVRLAAPFLVISLLFFVGLGLLARLMPQLQIFFVALPIQLAGGMFLFAVVLSGLFTVFLEYYADGLFTYVLRR